MVNREDEKIDEGAETSDDDSEKEVDHTTSVKKIQEFKQEWLKF